MKQTIFAVLATAAFACSSPAAVLLSETEFTNSIGDKQLFTAGSDSLNTFYYNGTQAGPRESAGNPGAYLSIGLYESSVVYALGGAGKPSSLDTVSFDLASTEQYSPFQLRIYGLTNGQTVTLGYNTGSTGTELLVSPGRGVTQGAWTRVTFDLSLLPAFDDLSAYDAIAFKFAGNFENPAPHGIDNFGIEGTAAVPEPTAALTLASGLGLLGMLRRRRKV